MNTITINIYIMMCFSKIWLLIMWVTFIGSYFEL